MLREKTMKTRNFENKLATVGAFFVLIGVCAAATSAFAEERADDATNGPAVRHTAEETIVGAQRANAESAAEAVRSLEAETRFDLENQLSDITTRLVAANK